MKRIKASAQATGIKYACAILFLIVSFGCAYKNQKITGKVVDESDVGLSSVSVTACYSGWGWSSAGYLVWDKVYCSKPVLTNDYGRYVVYFKGPDSLRLRAKKSGWIQTQDFNATDSQITLIKKEVYNERNRAEASLREKDFRKRSLNESASKYYCRVILYRSRSIDLNYQGGVLSVVPTLLKGDDRSDVIFAVKGATMATHSLANEIVFKINGQTINRRFSFRPGDKYCEPNINFIFSSIPYLHLEPDKRIEALVPSIRAKFDMQTWNLLADQ